MKRTHAYTFTASLCLIAAAGCRDNSDTSPNPPPVDMASSNDLTMTPDDLAMMPPDQSSPIDFSGVDLQIPPTQAPTEFMAVRIGDGSAVISGSSAPVFIERHKISDGTMVGTPIALPTAVSGTNKRLTLTNTSLAEGSLSLSGDGKYLLIGGYDADVATAAVASSASATVNRVVGRIDAAGNIDTSTAANFFTAQNPRSAISTNGTDLWIAGQPGIVYTTLGSAATPTSLLTNNMRWMQIYSGQLYATSGAGTLHGVTTIGTGTPKTTATATNLPGFPTANASPYGFVAFDSLAPAGIDVIYVADDNPLATGGGVQRWNLTGATWTLAGTLSKGMVTGGARGVTGYRSANSFTLVVTTNETPTRIVKFVDDGSAIDQITATQLATAGANTVYRGISLPAQ